MIKLDKVSFGYPVAGEDPILRSIDLGIEDGEWVAVTGGNGSGKSTLCRLIAGLASPSEGKVDVSRGGRVSGATVPGGSVLVGIAFQNPDSQFVTSTVRREILFGLENIGLGEREMTRRLGVCVDRFGLSRLIDRNPHTLSGGEKQRTLLACIWGMDPFHLVLDEPFSFLDAAGRSSFLELVRTSFRDEGRSVVWAALRRDEIELADRVVCLDGGRIVYDGSPSGFLGTAEAEILTDSADVCNDTAPPGTGGQSAGRLRGSLLEIEEAQFRPGGGDFVLNVEELGLVGGEVLGLSGPSGSGKTTLLLGCSGLLPPSRGTVTLLGTRVRSVRDFPDGRVSFLFQAPEEGFFATTVREEVGLGCRGCGDATELEGKVSGALESVGLDPGLFIDRSPFHLSQGERRLVALASIMVIPAEIFLLDEPALFLDGKAGMQLFEALGRLKSRDVGIVAASHEPRFHGLFSDRLIRLEAGEIVSSGA